MLEILHADWSVAYPMPRKNARHGLNAEVYAPRKTMWGVLAVFAAILLGALAFLIYAVTAGPGMLWAYAAAASGFAFLLLALSGFYNFRYRYVRLSLLGTWGLIATMSDCLIVIRNNGRNEQAWYCSSLSATFDGDRGVRVFVSADCASVTGANRDAKFVRAHRSLANAIRRRAYVQTDETDLRDYLRSYAFANRAYLARVARVGK